MKMSPGPAPGLAATKRPVDHEEEAWDGFRISPVRALSSSKADAVAQSVLGPGQYLPTHLPLASCSTAPDAAQSTACTGLRPAANRYHWHHGQR